MTVLTFKSKCAAVGFRTRVGFAILHVSLHVIYDDDWLKKLSLAFLKNWDQWLIRCEGGNF